MEMVDTIVEVVILELPMPTGELVCRLDGAIVDAEAEFEPEAIVPVNGTDEDET